MLSINHLLMETLTRSNTAFYGVTSAVAALMIVVVMGWLNWPLLASLILGAALFTHALILSKYVKDLYLRARDKNITPDISRQLKSLFVSSVGKQESEV